MSGAAETKPGSDFRRILGIDFFCGTAHAAVERMRGGGLLVVPAAPALKELGRDPSYREALLQADLAITDSAYMVLVWNLLRRDSVRRLSGLEYLRELLNHSDLLTPGSTFWIMAGERSAGTNLAWLSTQGIDVPNECVYLAPMYGPHIEDSELVERLNRLQPQHVVLTIGGGTQERLGLYLKRNVTYRPAIHCIGAAIAFLSGDQVNIPVFADRFYLGWLFRCVTEPKRYLPRYWGARKLLALLVKYRSELPPLET